MLLRATACVCSQRIQGGRAFPYSQVPSKYVIVSEISDAYTASDCTIYTIISNIFFGKPITSFGTLFCSKFFVDPVPKQEANTRLGVLET